MRDLNFFEPYIEKSDFKFDKRIIYLTLASFIIIGMASYLVYNSLIIRQEARMVAKLKLTAEDPRSIKKVEEIQAKSLEVEEFRESVNMIRKLDEDIEGRDIIDEDFLNSIIAKMPEEVFLTSISIHDDIQLVGISKDRWAVAEFEKGLEDIEIAEEVFVSNISFDESHYNFAVNITLKDVNEDGEEPSEEEKDQ